MRSPSRERRFLAVDGGDGATMLSALTAREKRLVRVWSPRHAELLVVFEPVSSALLPSIVEIHRAMPRPCAALAIGAIDAELLRDARLVRMEDVFPGLERCPSGASPTELANRMWAASLASHATPPAPAIDPVTLSLPDRSERDMATELLVLSLGPVQHFTAGPLRLLVAADGEQVESVTVEAGYAKRHLTQAMTRATLADAERLSSRIDPLAPMAGHLAYLAAIEELAQAHPGEQVLKAREAALALERACNHVAWLIRFAATLSVPWLEECARRSHLHIEAARGALDARAAVALRMAASELASLGTRIAKDRMLGLRTAGIGIIAADRLRAVGASGPALQASECGAGDVLSRIVARVDNAAEDVRHLIAAAASGVRPAAQNSRLGQALPSAQGRGGVEGPRGRIEVSLKSDGTSLRSIEWTRPSAGLLPVIPELLARQTLADAEVIMASLDLSMAEADG